MNENVDIFICTHKDFEKKVENDVYKVIDSRDLKKDFKIFGLLDDVELSEWYHMFWIAKNVELKDYVGICHYRRYFNFLDEVPNIEEIFKECEAIIRKPTKLDVTIMRQYELCHNIEDLNLMGDVIKDNFNNYYGVYNSFIKSSFFVPCNMVILKKDDFLELVNFGKEFLKEFLWRTNVDVYKRVFENEEKYIKKTFPNNTHKYQIRVLSFLLERITNIFIFKKYTKLKAYDAVITENKYGLRNNTI